MLPRLVNSSALRRVALWGGMTTTVTASACSMPTSPEPTVLAGRGDPYGGLSVGTDAVNGCKTSDCFADTLRSSIDEWKRSGKRGIWLQIPSSRPELIAVAREQDFEFHHAEKSYLMLNRWLSDSEPNQLPSNASHSLGVGIVCINDDGEVLVVREKRGPAAARADFWKVPTGLVNQGEDACSAALRELKEETGIDAQFVSLAGIREQHNGLHGKSNMYMVCVVKPLHTDIQLQLSELADAKWMNVANLTTLKHYTDGTVYSELNRAAIQVAGRPKAGLLAENLPVGFRPGSHTVYLPAKV